MPVSPGFQSISNVRQCPAQYWVQIPFGPHSSSRSAPPRPEPASPGTALPGVQVCLLPAWGGRDGPGSPEAASTTGSFLEMAHTPLFPRAESIENKNLKKNVRLARD